MAVSIRQNIQTARKRLLESYSEAEVRRACAARIEGLRSSFPRKLKDLKALAEQCGLAAEEIIVFEALAPRTLPAECTGFVSAGSASKDGVTINAKVRELDARYIQGIAAEPRASLRRPAGKHRRFPANRFTRSYSFFGCKTLGRWGVGMGMNEFGVSVGDHTSFAKDPLHPGTGLESNDVCRLVLEGSRTAEEGAALVKELVEGHGHSREGQMYFVADSREGWIVEATSERCAAVRVRDSVGVRANGYKIGAKWDTASDDLVAYALKAGLWDGRGRFNFAESYSKPFPWAADRRFRYRRAVELLSKRIADGSTARARNGVAGVRRGMIGLGDGLRVLSDHAAEVGRGRARKVTRGGAISGVDVRRDPKMQRIRQICSHFRFPSVSAQIAVHDPGLPVEAGCAAWICLGNPCLTVYVPIPAGTTRIAAGFADGSVWGKFAEIERRSKGRYKKVKGVASKTFDCLQDDLRSGQVATAADAGELVEAGKSREARRLLEKSVRSAFRSIESAADEVLSRLKESGF